MDGGRPSKRRVKGENVHDSMQRQTLDGGSHGEKKRMTFTQKIKRKGWWEEEEWQWYVGPDARMRAKWWVGCCTSFDPKQSLSIQKLGPSSSHLFFLSCLVFFFRPVILVTLRSFKLIDIVHFSLSSSSWCRRQRFWVPVSHCPC